MRCFQHHICSFNFGFIQKMKTFISSEKFETKLKFKRNEKSGELVAFVRETNGRLLGVDESQSKKKICLLSKEVKEQNIVEEKVLYDVVLVKMNFKNGYVVKQATPTLFKAKVSIQITPKLQYQVVINFGHKKVYYNPFNGQSDNVTSLDNIIAYIQNRKDLKNIDTVIKDLKEAAEILKDKMEADGYDTSVFPIRFEHSVSYKITRKIEYTVTVHIGDKGFVYNPFYSTDKNEFGNLSLLIVKLESRKDIADMEALKKDLYFACNKIWNAMEADGYVCQDRYNAKP